ncbi:12024_t:CDS:2 [Dentiscutata heterogama]|uniref:12024_t:CDS:1 n=1 Tax=Dentiscutata heterogama TaxID=1316150 RepID=A0ACA9LB73_9GLOM|nr:12024_t:CDS:2 [Dentiscutata heterogama]
MSSDKEKSLSHTAIPIFCHETSQISTLEPQIPPSSKSKFFFLFTKEFAFILFWGQFLSLCFTGSIVIVTALTINYHISLPATLSFFMYTTLTLICTPITIYKNGIRAYLRMLRIRGWKYVEANYFGIKAYAYTSILSTILLDAWAIPVCVILSIFFLHIKYHWSQYLGVGICLAGIGVLIEADFQSGKDMYYAVDPIKGDILCLISATFFGISNIIEEYYVKKRPAYEVLGQMGFWGMIVSGIQTWFLFKTVMHVLYPLAAVCTILGLLVFYIYPATQPVVKCDDEDSIEQVVSDEETAATNTSESVVRALNRSV